MKHVDYVNLDLYITYEHVRASQWLFLLLNFDDPIQSSKSSPRDELQQTSVLFESRCTSCCSYYRGIVHAKDTTRFDKTV